MKQLYQNTTKTALVMAIASILAACGGGSDATETDTTATSQRTQTSQTTTSTNTQVTNPTSTGSTTGTGSTSTTNTTIYLPASEASVFTWLNQQRQTCGFGGLSYNAELTKAADNHNKYMAYVSETTSSTKIFTSHDEKTEDSTWKNTGMLNPYYTGLASVNRVKTDATKGSKAVAVNYPYATSYWVGTMQYKVTSGGFVSENLASSNDETDVELLKNLLASPYHLRSLVHWYFKEVGIDYHQSNFWAPAGYLATAANYLGIVLGLQQGQSPYIHTQTLNYPCNGVTGTEFKLTNESPDPFYKHPTRSLISSDKPIGQPVYIIAPTGKVISNISNVSMQPVNGVVRPKVWIMFKNANSSTNENQMQDMNGRLLDNEAFLIPDTPLSANTTYTVTYTLTYSDGTTESKTFNFTTKAS